MERRKPKLSVSKSVPSITSKCSSSPRSTRKIIHSGSKRSRTLHKLDNERVKEFKRNIIPNPEKQVSRFRKPYFIYEKGVNHTPKGLYDPLFPGISEKLFTGLPAGKGPRLTQQEKLIFGDVGSLTSVGSVVSRVTVQRRSSVARPSVVSLGLTSFTEVSFGSVVLESDVEEEFRPSIDRAPSMFRLREDPVPKKKKIEKEFKVNLELSETLFLLQNPLRACEKESAEGIEIQTKNEEYEKFKYGSKSISHTATQTANSTQKHRRLHILRNKRANSSSWATVWDIYDTMLERNRTSILRNSSLEEGMITRATSEENLEESQTDVDELLLGGYKIGKRLLNALMVMERIITKRSFREKQLLFQGLLLDNPFSTDVRYNYSFVHLWTFKCDKTLNKKVTSICGNPANQNILAVGYGKYKYADKDGGLVCIWNVKNPTNPERVYKFENPVTFLSFNPYRPHILAVSLYNGAVLMLDIICRTLFVKASNYHYPLYSPVWQVRFAPQIESSEYQFLITSGKNGIIYRYKKSKFFTSKKIMSMARPHGTIPGVVSSKKCYARKTLLSRYPSAEVLVLHPSDPHVYLVGTSEGCVYFCSVNYRHDHLDVFLAHNGPVYNIQFNPFCPKVFLTCGADWCIRIWAEGIFEPLITLESGMLPVQCALWDPLRSTIIVSITGTLIEVWDIRRRVSKPTSVMHSPSQSFNNVLCFSQNKYNLYVGDASGNVHALALTEMPFIPTFQDQVLAQAIRNVLVTRPDLLERLWKMGSPFSSEWPRRRSKIHVTLNV